MAKGTIAERRHKKKLEKLIVDMETKIYETEENEGKTEYLMNLPHKFEDEIIAYFTRTGIAIDKLSYFTTKTSVSWKSMAQRAADKKKMEDIRSGVKFKEASKEVNETKEPEQIVEVNEEIDRDDR